MTLSAIAAQAGIAESEIIARFGSLSGLLEALYFQFARLSSQVSGLLEAAASGAERFVRTSTRPLPCTMSARSPFPMRCSSSPGN